MLVIVPSMVSITMCLRSCIVFLSFLRGDTYSVGGWLVLGRSCLVSGEDFGITVTAVGLADAVADVSVLVLCDLVGVLGGIGGCCEQKGALWLCLSCVN